MNSKYSLFTFLGDQCTGWTRSHWAHLLLWVSASNYFSSCISNYCPLFSMRITLSAATIIDESNSCHLGSL